MLLFSNDHKLYNNEPVIPLGGNTTLPKTPYLENKSLISLIPVFAGKFFTKIIVLLRWLSAYKKNLSYI